MEKGIQSNSTESQLWVQLIVSLAHGLTLLKAYNVFLSGTAGKRDMHKHTSGTQTNTRTHRYKLGVSPVIANSKTAETHTTRAMTITLVCMMALKQPTSPPLKDMAENCNNLMF